MKDATRTPKYHETDAHYALPNDEQEHVRLLKQYHAFTTLMKGRTIHAPASFSNSSMVDIGCGTGVITRYLASRLEGDSHIYGIDISSVPTEPEDVNLPQMQLIKGDFRKLAEEDSRLQPNSVDFVHSRLLVSGMTDWPGYVRSIYTITKPGGWVELSDHNENVFYFDRSLYETPPEDAKIIPSEDWPWLKAIRTASAKKNMDLDAGLNIPRYMTDAGFTDIQTYRYRMPYWRDAVKIIPEAKEIVEMFVDDQWGCYWHAIPMFLKGEGYSDAEIRQFQEDSQRDLRDEVGKEQVFCVTIGRKPDI